MLPLVSGVVSDSFLVRAFVCETGEIVGMAFACETSVTVARTFVSETLQVIGETGFVVVFVVVVVVEVGAGKFD